MTASTQGALRFTNAPAPGHCATFFLGASMNRDAPYYPDAKVRGIKEGCGGFLGARGAAPSAHSASFYRAPPEREPPRPGLRQPDPEGDFRHTNLCIDVLVPQTTSSCGNSRLFVIPAKAGIQASVPWTPASAGVTVKNHTDLCIGVLDHTLKCSRILVPASRRRWVRTSATQG